MTKTTSVVAHSELVDGTSTTLHSHAGGSGANVKQIEIDFGDVSFVTEGIFNITDVDVTVNSKIIAEVAYVAPTNKDLDEIEMDDIEVKAKPNAGNLELWVKSTSGSIYGKFKINYLVA